MAWNDNILYWQSKTPFFFFFLKSLLVPHSQEKHEIKYIKASTNALRERSLWKCRSLTEVDWEDWCHCCQVSSSFPILNLFFIIGVVFFPLSIHNPAHKHSIIGDYWTNILSTMFFAELLVLTWFASAYLLERQICI